VLLPPGEEATYRLAAIVESSDDAIVSKDLNGIVVTWNQGAERLFGYTAADMIGQSILRIIPDERRGEEEQVLSRIRRGDRVEHFETERRRKDGTLIPISLTVSPIRDNTGRVIGASKIARDISERHRYEADRARLLALAVEHAEVTQQLNDVGRLVSSTLERDAIVQAVTDTARRLTGAEFGAFFFNVDDPATGEQYQLYAVSGADRQQFEGLGHPRATELFAQTFRGDPPVRLADVTQDSRYGKMPPHFGLPPGHLPVRSYLAVPVRARSGHALGALLFAHAAPDMFNEQHERQVVGIAGWASLALENAGLYVAAQEASRLKDEFLATLSHELRTPLNAILGYLRMVRTGLVSGERQDRAMETIERNAMVLTQIVEDILDVSRIVAGKIRLDMTTVDMAEVLDDALGSVLPAARAKGIDIEKTAEPGVSLVSGDRERLQQVVWNLLSNAVKFTDRGGKVSARLERAHRDTVLTVEDTGAGIAPEFLPHVFERFRQADSSATREKGGLGLGLSIARHMVETHGGSIEAHSGGLGRGATFRVTLPLVAAVGSLDSTAQAS
jgi:PAS domain S-box-containing protein